MNIDEILSFSLFERKVLFDIQKWMERDRVLLVVGSRQVGKTSLLFLLIQSLIKKGFPKESVYYFDLEDQDLLEIFNCGYREFIKYLESLGQDFQDRVYVFIDEIQYLENPSNFLKLLHDHYKNIKVVCSGSSTLQIRKKFQDSLVGRKLVFELYPLSFDEFLNFQGRDDLGSLLRKYSLDNILVGEEIEKLVPLLKKELDSHFEEYIRFGGYPEGVKEEDYENKVVLLNEIHGTYIQRDINQMFSIENVSAFNRLIQLTALQIGNLVNLRELTTNIGTAWKTVETYFFILENTFILKRLNPFYSNKRKELSKMPKIYFHDTGLRNRMVKNSNRLEIRTDAGALVENYVFQHLYRNLKVDEDLKFWRSQNGNEVDFIMESDRVIPIEVKYRPLNEAQIPQGIRFFLQKYPCRNAVVVTKDFLGQREINGCRVSFVPVYLIA